MNPQKRNTNGSAWTQFPNGEWKITGSKEGPNQNVDETVWEADIEKKQMGINYYQK